MNTIKINIKNEEIPIRIHRYSTVIVGSGAAGYNCAHTLASLEKMNPKNHTFAIVTEGVNMGTSRNTGSDKQTYYKLSTTAAKPDCALNMAKDLFSGGSMHGDIALTEALGSLKSFYKLVNLGVPFPHDKFGEYTGYKTDHDEKMRASSCGPLTSKYMTECLEKAVSDFNIPAFDGYRVIGLIKKDNHVTGICVISEDELEFNRFGLCIFSSENIVYAVGGPSAVYESTVYPKSQTCALGCAFLSGAEGVNLTESQYGIASVKFRWNLSGSYQQVIPRYISIDENGTEHEFLYDYFSDNSPSEIAHAVFMLGYQWPFDPRRIFDEKNNIGSSSIDLAVFSETCKGRKVYLDFMNNPKGISANSEKDIGAEAYLYLKNSSATGETPIKRLRSMNEKAYQLYLSNGIDLEHEMLEINVCAQHCNGGLSGDIWYESTSLKGFYPVGEANGVFGIRRPGGSALNSTQVGSMRAAEKIHATYQSGKSNETDISIIPSHIFKLLEMIDNSGSDPSHILQKRKSYAKRMSECGSFLRNPKKISQAITETKKEIENFFSDKENLVSDFQALRELTINYDILITQYVMLSSIEEYIKDSGQSRGSYVITDKEAEDLINSGKNPSPDEIHSDKMCYVSIDNNLNLKFRWENVRPIPENENWFETVMADFGKTDMYL